MATVKMLHSIALSLPQSNEEPHFEKTSFRVKGKIFATFDAKKNRATVKLSLVEQDVFCSSNKGLVYPVDNAWGKQGWTLVEISKINKEMLEAIVKSAYCAVAPKKLGDAVQKTMK